MRPQVVRPYRPEEDAASVFALWQASLEPAWPTTLPLFRGVTEHRTCHSSDHFVAIQRDQVVGFVATQVDRHRASPTRKGGIALLVVHPEARRQGIGRTLHDTAFNHLRRAGVQRAQLAGGGSARFWPGVPANLPEALAFFQACGWEYSETSYDLVQHLGSYQTPPGMFQRVAEGGFAIEGVHPDDAGELLTFEKREFPEWAGAFSHLITDGSYEDMLVARDAAGAVVGSLFVFSRETRSESASVVWRRLLGDDMGGLACVGTAATMRDRGIGTALVARGTEILKTRGVGYSHVGWTWLLNFYGRLGYRVWREYQMSWRDL
jgi:beta-N-acetylhexosaminidase